MKEYATEQIRNVVLLGHGGTGKTSFSEAALFAAGAISRLGRVDDGNTTSDYDPDEVKRQISISLSLLPCEWDGHKVNLIDTPGYADFLGEVKEGIRAADAALGGLPRLVFVNRMDRENADFAGAVQQVRERFGKRCVPIQVPIGARETLQGVVDLLEMRAFLGAKAEP